MVVVDSFALKISINSLFITAFIFLDEDVLDRVWYGNVGVLIFMENEYVPGHEFT